MMNAIHKCFQDAQNCYVQVTRKTTQKGNSELISERDIWQLTTCYWVYMVKIQGVFMKRGFRKLMGLKPSWDYLQQYNFHSWFLKYETEEQKLQNWLRLVPVIFTNQVETANNNVKDWLGRSNKFPVAIRQTEEYVAEQQQEFEIAIYGNGPYERVMLICEKLVIFGIPFTLYVC